MLQFDGVIRIERFGLLFWVKHPTSETRRKKDKRGQGEILNLHSKYTSGFFPLIFKKNKYFLKFKKYANTCHSCSLTPMHMHYVQIEKYQFDFFFFFFEQTFSNPDMDLTMQEDMIRTIKAIMKKVHCLQTNKQAKIK